MKLSLTLKELQRWLGVGNYLRKYIKNYAELAKPLYDLMDLKNVPKELRKRNGAPYGKLINVEWTSETTEAWENLRDVLSSELVLALPDYDRPMLLSTDACEYGFGRCPRTKF